MCDCDLLVFNAMFFFRTFFVPIFTEWLIEYVAAACSRFFSFFFDSMAEKKRKTQNTDIKLRTEIQH